MGAPAARYDGHADWYDATFGPHPDEEELLRSVLPSGRGAVCLDVACGALRYGPTLGRLGYRVVGIDVSADQLRRARRRASGGLVRAEAGHIPIRTGEVAAAVGFYFHTDVEDFAAVAAEVRRCLAPDGTFVYVGLHPCFIGAFVDRTAEADTHDLRFTTGYGRSGWAWPDFNKGARLWVKVGGNHKTLAEFLNAFIDARFVLDRVIELDGGGTILPRNIAVVASVRQS